jgi:hypothetical protein
VELPIGEPPTSRTVAVNIDNPQKKPAKANEISDLDQQGACLLRFWKTTQAGSEIYSGGFDSAASTT